jgi:glutaminyl-tRNA synthetase
MAVLRPLKVIIDNYPKDKIEWLDAPYWPHDIPKTGSRKIAFSREIFIERDDFLETPSKDFFRLAPGCEVRLRYGYCITCTHVEKDAAGQVIAVHCNYDPETRSGAAPMGRKVKGTIHWVYSSALIGEVRLYHHLLLDAQLAPDVDFLSRINPHSLEVITGCRLEHSLKDAAPGERYQFERQGYFFVDPIDSKGGKLIFNRIITLKDSWGKKQHASPIPTLSN